MGILFRVPFGFARRWVFYFVMGERAAIEILIVRTETPFNWRHLVAD
ncbi:MAG: hypothetical protein WAV20_12200 [Blastocatellia bacterium]